MTDSLNYLVDFLMTPLGVILMTAAVITAGWNIFFRMLFFGYWNYFTKGERPPQGGFSIERREGE